MAMTDVTGREGDSLRGFSPISFGGQAVRMQLCQAMAEGLAI
jgi:hypothetical protein